MAISSANFQKTKSNSVAETTRQFEAKYLLPKEHRGQNEFYNCGTDENILFEQELEKAERKGGRVPKFENSLWEGLLNLNENHTIEDVNRVGEHIAKKFNFHYTRGALHRDEGHINKKGKVEYNYHAHVNFMTYKDGKQNWRLEFIDKKALSDLQTEVAELLGMERGEFNSKSVRANHRHFREKAEEIKNSRLNLKELEKLRDENKSLKKENSSLKGQGTKNKKEIEKLRDENKDLKSDNEALKYSKKELENQIKDLGKNLREALKDLGASRADYAQLEQMNKDLKEELKNERLNQEKVVKSYEDLEQKLRAEITKKDEKIDDLEVENKDLKNELEALKYQLDLKEKRSQAYFGLNQELKSEIIALKSQITDLEEQKEVLEDKVVELDEKVASRANTDDLSSTKKIKKEDYLTQIVNQYDSSRTGKEESESSHTKKTMNVTKLAERQNERSLLDKFAEIDKKAVLEQAQEPVKKRSQGRER